MKKIIIVLISIGLFAGVWLRFFELGRIPEGINVDEAVYGYDAFSISKTGTDIWGEDKISLKSFGDYKPAGFAHTLIPIINWRGLDTISTRLPSAIFGIATVGLTIWLGVILFGDISVALLIGMIFALSPWHFGISRLFYEPNIGLFFIVLGTIQGIFYLKKNKISHLLLTALLYAIAGYYYAVLRYVGIALIFMILVVNKKMTWKNRKMVVLVGLTWLLAASPYINAMFGSIGLTRLKQESDLHNLGSSLVINEDRQMCYLLSNRNRYMTGICYVLWNKVGENLVNSSKTYISLLSPQYLFLSSSQKDVLPNQYGAYLALLLPLFILGISAIAQQWDDDKNVRFVLLGLLVSPIPIATAQVVSVHRNVIGLYFVLLIIGYGLKYLADILSKSSYLIGQRLIPIILLTLLSWSQARYMTNYFFVFTRFNTAIWQTEVPRAMRWLGEHRNGRKIFTYNYDFSPLYYAFFNSIDPEYFKENVIWEESGDTGWYTIIGLGEIINTDNDYWDNICEAKDTKAEAMLLVIPPHPEWQAVAEVVFEDAINTHNLEDIYDSRKLYNYLVKTDPKLVTRNCQAIESNQ